MILYVPDWACVICLVLALALTLIALHDFDSYLKHNRGDGMSNSTSFDFGDVLRDPKTRTRYVVGETKLYGARTGAVIALDEEKRSKLVKVGTIFNNLSKKLFTDPKPESKQTGVKRYAFNSYSTLVGMIQGCRDDKLHINLCETASYSTKKNVAYKMLADYESSGDLHASLIAEYGKYACFGYRQVFVFSTLNGVHGFAEALRKHDGGVPVYEYTGASKPSVLGLGDDDVIVITTGMLSEYQTRRVWLIPATTLSTGATCFARLLFNLCARRRRCASCCTHRRVTAPLRSHASSTTSKRWRRRIVNTSLKQSTR